MPDFVGRSYKTNELKAVKTYASVGITDFTFAEYFTHRDIRCNRDLLGSWRAAMYQWNCYPWKLEPEMRTVNFILRISKVFSTVLSLVILSINSRKSFLVNKTNRRTKFQFYWYYYSTCFGQPFCPSSGVLSRTSALVHFMQLWWTVCYQK